MTVRTSPLTRGRATSAAATRPTSRKAGTSIRPPAFKEHHGIESEPDPAPGNPRPDVQAHQPGRTPEQPEDPGNRLVAWRLRLQSGLRARFVQPVLAVAGFAPQLPAVRQGRQPEPRHPQYRRVLFGLFVGLPAGENQRKGKMRGAEGNLPAR